MPVRRASEAVERRLRAEIAKWQEKMRPYSEVVQGFDGEFWGLVVGRLKNTAENIATEREQNFKKMTETELKISIAEEAMIKDIMRLPSRDRAIQLKMAERLAQARENLRNYQKNKG